MPQNNHRNPTLLRALGCLSEAEKVAMQQLINAREEAVADAEQRVDDAVKLCSDAGIEANTAKERANAAQEAAASKRTVAMAQVQTGCASCQCLFEVHHRKQDRSSKIVYTTMCPKVQIPPVHSVPHQSSVRNVVFFPRCTVDCMSIKRHTRRQILLFLSWTLPVT